MTLDTDVFDGETLIDFPAQKIEVIPFFGAGNWTEVPYLRCERFELNANGYDQADLKYVIGEGVLQPGASVFGDSPPLDIHKQFVRITFYQGLTSDSDTDYVWHGYVLIDELARDGVKTDGGGMQKFVGAFQMLTAVGLEYLLDRKQIDIAVVEGAPDPESEAPDEPTKVRILRPMVFNGGASHQLDPDSAGRGNRGALIPDDDEYVFTNDPTTEIMWSAEDMVGHLLKYHTLQDKDNKPSPCEFMLDPDQVTSDPDEDTGKTNPGILAGFHPTISMENETVFRVLHKIANPQRGLQWWLETRPDPNDDTIVTGIVRVATFATEDIDLSNDENGQPRKFPANENPQSLDFDTELDVKDVAITDHGSRNYHRVKCRGAHITLTMTIGWEDSTLLPDWTEDDEDAYKDAAEASDGYGALAPGKQADRNDEYRKSDWLKYVYSYFRIPADWDGKVGNGSDSTKNTGVFTGWTPGDVSALVPINPAGMRLLNELRLKLGWNYKTANTPVPNTPDDHLAGQEKPFAIIKVETGANADSDRYQLIEKLSRRTRFHAGTPVSPRIHTSYSLAMQPTVPGIIVKSSEVAHTIALEDFDNLTEEPTKVKPEVDWKTMRATVCLEVDAYCEGTYQTTPLPDNTPIEELVIELGDQYRLDLLPENTVVGLDAGVPVYADDNATLRDDRDTLNDVARIAYEWYREDRRSMVLVLRQLRNLFDIGMLVTTVGSGTTQTTLNTVVSKIIYDFKDGLTTVHTSDEALDLRSLADGRHRHHVEKRA